MSERTLLVALSDRVSDWVRKGEVVDRYFNPGDVFDRVVLLLTNDDRPPLDALQRMAGRASVEVRNVPAGRFLFAATLGWRPLLLRPWARRAVRIGREVRPDLVRCHGVRLGLFAASRVRDDLGVPLVVSLHGNPDVDELRGRRARTPLAKLVGRLVESVERHGLRRADLALAVYEPIVPYLRRMGVARWEVAYNVVGHGVRARTSWAISGRAKAICVARQWPDQKDPRPIIAAVAAVPEVELLLIGGGPLHEEVRRAAAASGAADRIAVVEWMANDAVLDALATADLFVYRSDNHEISKGCMEASLAGLPIVANRRAGGPAPELEGGHVLLVDGDAASYEAALRELVASEDARRHLGQAARAFAEQRWEPGVAERRVADLYRELLGP